MQPINLFTNIKSNLCGCKETKNVGYGDTEAEGINLKKLKTEAGFAVSSINYITFAISIYQKPL